MTDPFAAMRLVEIGVYLSAEAAGNTDKSAPVSTRKEHPEAQSLMVNEPTLESIEEIAVGEGVPGVKPSRRDRFPTVADG